MANPAAAGTLATVVAVLGFLSIGLLAACEKWNGKAGILGFGVLGFDYLLLMAATLLATY